MVACYTIIAAWVVEFVLHKISSKNTILRKVCSTFSFIKYSLLNIMYFDLQIVVFSELSIVDVFRSLRSGKIFDTNGASVGTLIVPFRIYFSFVTSVAILLLMLSELKEIFLMRRRKQLQFKEYI